MNIEARVSNLERDGDRHEHDVKALFRDLAEVRGEAGRGVAAAQQALRMIPEISRRSTSRQAKAEEPAEDAVVWLTLDDSAAATGILFALEEWLSAVYVHYPEGELRDCWRRHGAVVEELLVLRDAHAAAWSGETGSPAARLDWHGRYRPDVTRRVNEMLDKCGIETHVWRNPADFRPPRVPGSDDVVGVATWWASTHGQSPDPAPSPGVLAEARARKDAERQARYQY